MEQLTLRGPTKSRASQIIKRFKVFHKAHPEAFWGFVRIADEKRRHYKTYSSQTIWGELRYQLKYRANGEGPKLNDHYKTYYARLYMIYRNCPGFLEIRHRTSEDRPAYKTDLAFHHTGDAGDEVQLNEILRKVLEETPDEDA